MTSWASLGGRLDSVEPARLGRRALALLSAFGAAALGLASWDWLGAVVRQTAIELPTPVQLGFAALVIVGGTALALALDAGGPSASAFARRTLRGARAAFRRRFRRGRSRGDLANAEVGAAMAAGALALFGLVFAGSSVEGLGYILILAIAIAIYGNVHAILALTRQSGFHPGRSAALGFLFGIAVGYFLR